MLDRFDIARRWPATRPEAIQLYSRTTPNGIKVSAMLEETGLDYEAHRVSFEESEQKTPEFLSLNPNGKIPAILDPHGPGGRPLALFESGAILVYLAEKTGRFLSANPATRYETLQWLMWQMGGAGPMFGQFGFFHGKGGADIEDKRPLERYRAETRRLLGVLDDRLAGRDHVVGDAYSIADMAIWPWVRTLDTSYHAWEELGLDRLVNVGRWFAACLERPASVEAIAIPSA